MCGDCDIACLTYKIESDTKIEKYIRNISIVKA